MFWLRHCLAGWDDGQGWMPLYLAVMIDVGYWELQDVYIASVTCWDWSMFFQGQVVECWILWLCLVMELGGRLREGQNLSLAVIPEEAYI